MGLFDTVITTKPRPLPVFALIDVSGSMGKNGKIEICNQAVRDMIRSLTAEDDTIGEIQLAVITFGGDEPSLHQPLTPVVDVEWADMQAAGRTPLGAALVMAVELIENTEVVPRRSYLPTIVIVSDGIPTDDWKAALARLAESSRAHSAMRLAIAIQAEPGDETYVVLRTLVGDASRVYRTTDAAGIAQALEWVTLSIAQRARSSDPNELPPPPPVPDLDDL
jgi:uncharacterized protein YegL